jgi:hypothetical protein
MIYQKKMNDVDSLYTDKDNFIVVLDSRNATQHGNGSYNSQMTFIFQDAIRVPRFAIRFLCSVLQFQSPNSLYNVNETNNTLIVTINAVKTTYTITKGNYNCNTFITAVLSILPTGFTMTMNSITNIYSLTYTSDFSITGTCGQLMGFYGYGTISSISKTLTMPFTCNFNGIQSFNIHLTNIVTKNIDSYTKSVSSIIQSIPVDSTSSSISYIKNADFNFVITQEVLDSLTIELRDDLGNLLNFNNQNWNLTLYFSVIKDIDRFSYLTNFYGILHGR